MSKSTKEQKEKLIFDLTKKTYDLLNIPPEKISVVIQEVGNESWGRGGFTRNHPDFDTLSRKHQM
ncbi:4-oxalocrotonate tautomerase family enzyme [Enterococcus gilvus]|nr:4-oxalocrotonate tautomerase family enzyme [Enterococcus gilvus]